MEDHCARCFSNINVNIVLYRQGAMSNSPAKLHWTQRVALVRHNLHAASRSCDFKFFKALQAAGFVEGTNHVATLSAEMGDDADIVLAAMDNLNAGLAYVHQDAFMHVYENLKDDARDSNGRVDMSKLHVDITMQKNTADMAIDKTTSSAISLINQQPENVQDCAANVWITGITIIADCMEITLQKMDQIDEKLDDFIRLEESWNTVKASIVCAVTGLKGVFRLMDASSPLGSQKSSPRSSRVASASGAMFRYVSNAFAGPGASVGRRNSRINSMPVNSTTCNGSMSPPAAAPVYRTPNYVRNSVSAGCPTSLSSLNAFSTNNSPSSFEPRSLSMIPHTPAAEEEHPDPFDNSMPHVPAVADMPSAGGGPMTISLALDGERRLSQVMVV